MDCCETYLELLSQRLDSPLTQEQEQSLADHLAVCPQCRALERELTAIHDVFSDLDEIQAPEGFAQGVIEKIKAQEGQKNKVVPLFRRPQIRALTGLAACAVLCVGLYTVARSGRPHTDAGVYGLMTASGQEVDREQEPLPEAIQGEQPPTQQRKQGPTNFALESGPRVNSALANQMELGGQKVDAVMTVEVLPEGADELLGADVQWQTDQQGYSYCLVTWDVMQAVNELLQTQGDTTAAIVTYQGGEGLCAIVRTAP